MQMLNSITQKQIFILGKGGTGKTVFAKALAQHLAAQKKRVLICHILQIETIEQKLTKPNEKVFPSLFEITLNSSSCFEEYVRLKLPLKKLADLLLHNRIVQYLEKSAPGVQEMVLMGKLWHDSQDFDHVVIDMPSTGYALTMIHTPFNFVKLFPGGPIYHDSLEIIKSYQDPTRTKYIIVALPEEMPLQESIECKAEMAKLIQKNEPMLVVNRIIRMNAESKSYFEQNSEISSPVQNTILWKSLKHQYFKVQKQIRQIEQLKLNWKNQWLELTEFPAINESEIVMNLAEQLNA